MKKDYQKINLLNNLRINMLKKFTTKELIFIALLGALVFVLDFILVVGLEAVIGIPGVGLLIDTIILIAIAVVGAKIVPKFGVFTIWALIYSVLAIPTNIIGPPGIYKIVIGLVLGLLGDVILFLFRYKNLGYYLSLTIANVLTIPFLYFFLIKLGLPGASELKSAVVYFIPIVVVEGLLGAWIGIKLYNKIKTKRFVKQLQS